MLRWIRDDHRDRVAMANAMPIRWRLAILALASAAELAAGIILLPTQYHRAALIFFVLAATLPVEVGRLLWRRFAKSS